MNKQDIVKYIRKKLIGYSDGKTRNSFQRFFKEKVKCHGVKSSLVGKAIKETYGKVSGLSRKEVFDVCEELFKSGYCEEAWVASNFVSKYCKKYLISDFKVFERWINKYIDNWAECNGFCTDIMASLIDQYPKYKEKVKKWTKSRNRWVKRASALSFIVAARRGGCLKDVFEISDTLLIDKDDMVQKGYGWLLKESSRLNQKKVFDFVYERRLKMPRTALRYAIEKMPQDLRKKAMSK